MKLEERKCEAGDEMMKFGNEIRSLDNKPEAWIDG